jgi:hypothetical protein
MYTFILVSPVTVTMLLSPLSRHYFLMAYSRIICSSVML